MRNYDSWNFIKNNLDLNVIRLNFHVRDIWFCYLGANVGDEQDGAPETFIRPVIIVQKFNNHLCWIVPLTRTEKESRYYFSFSFIGNDWSTVVLSQNRSVDAKRLIRKIGFINKSDFAVLIEKLKALLP